MTFKNNKILVRHDVIPEGAHADAFQFRSTYIDNLNIIGNIIGYAHQNIFHQSIGAGPWSNINIINNVSLQRGAGGFSGKHVFVADVTNLNIEGNSFATITDNENVDYSWAINTGSVAGNFAVHNNIFYNALYLSVAPSTDYNLFYNVTSKPTVGSYSSLSQFQAANPSLEVYSLEANPNFNALANEDLRLFSNSPAIDNGSNVFDPLGELDLLGHPRKISNNVDMEAIEFLK